MRDFDSETLPRAVAKLFTLHNYKVEGPLMFHGASLDLLASPIGQPFAGSVAIEVTTEHVDNDKYGRDLTKLALLREKDSKIQLVIVSSSGFSQPVKERASETGVQTLTYNELFRRFERFEPYVSLFTGDSDRAHELQKLNAIYEEPLFEDTLGIDPATSFLSDWRSNESPKSNWLVIVGEYGTGKTALTKVLQYRWLLDYLQNPGSPLPIRIELRDFTRQFDARGLLHHFLDSNGLAHIPLDFVLSLIKQGRIILLLDGYDEMAQYLQPREKRSCLEALAHLSAGGAKGILTSRPNYFTESEELQVFDVLYTSIEHGRYFLGRDAKRLVEAEKAIDNLLENFFERYERYLKDLTPDQTEMLVQRVLHDDPAGCRLVLGLLQRVFRTTTSGDKVSLSGKPVIVTYLLDVVEGLKSSSLERASTKALPAPSLTLELDSNEPSDQARVIEGDEKLSEAAVYCLIIDQLMLRDLARSPELGPHERRAFLQRLALFLSRRENATVTEEQFRDLIAREFRSKLQRVGPESKSHYLDRLFADLRGSATLTRATAGEGAGLQFSHNSLREYFVFEYFLAHIKEGVIPQDEVPISESMRFFAGSLGDRGLRVLTNSLASAWRAQINNPSRGRVFGLFLEGFVRLFEESASPATAVLEFLAGKPVDAKGVDLDRVLLSAEDQPAELGGANFSSSNISRVSFLGANLEAANFSDCILENVSFALADLRGCRFDPSSTVPAPIPPCPWS